jgi:ankyrin repeat protein
LNGTIRECARDFRPQPQDAAEFLIEAGANVNANEEEKAGDTPLAAVAETCSLAMARILVEAGADPTIPGWMQLTALDRAERRNDPDAAAIQELLQGAAKRRHDNWQPTTNNSSRSDAHSCGLSTSATASLMRDQRGRRIHLRILISSHFARS